MQLDHRLIDEGGAEVVRPADASVGGIRPLRRFLCSVRMAQSGPRRQAVGAVLGRTMCRQAPPDAEANFCKQKDAVRLPQVRIVWVMVAVVIAALDFGAIRAFLDPRVNGPGRPPGIVLLLGALPMANVLAVGVLIGQRRPGSRPFLLGFETFGAMALAVFVALAICFPREVVFPYMAPFLYPVETIIGPGRPVLYIPIGGFVVLVVLGLPQFVFALIGGSLSRRFKITITPR